ncbi:MAG: substrate-binding domain-containing protein [Lawsonibacter sp.]|nr:substrate-binding domain-containing protein [Lawsonibacter sp.]
MDYAVYGRAAAEALFNQGHRRIAFLAEEDTYPERMIFEGICQYLRSRLIGIMPEDFRIFSSDAGFDLLKEGYTAAICSGNQVSACLSQQMSKLLSSIPQDFSIVALSSSSDGLDLPLSKLILPFAEYGGFLIRRLVQEIDREEPFCAFTPTLPAALPLTSISTPKDYPSKHIIVVGSIHMDVNINSDNLPQLGRTSSVRGMSMIPGGKGINQAIGVAKLNKEVHLIGRIGSDFDGITVQDALSKYHVHSDGIVKDSSDTGRAFIFILGNGESAITNYDGANKNLSISDISRSSHLFRRADFCLLQTEIPMETVIYAAKLAKRNKVKIILKPAAITEISDELLSIVDYFVPNEKEIDLLCPYPLNHSQQCEYFLKKGVKTVILTMGNRGCYLYRKDDAQYFPASGHIAADTTGGSDAFISALATYLSENVELHQAIQYAIYAAGFCVSRQGVVPALIDRESLELYRKKEEAKAIQ